MEDKEIQKESESKKDSEREEITLIDADFIDTQSTNPIEYISIIFIGVIVFAFAKFGIIPGIVTWVVTWGISMIFWVR